MRIIDAVLDPDRAKKLRERAEQCEHPVVEIARTDDRVSLRVLVLHSDPDEFLEQLRQDLRSDGSDPCDAHYAVFEPLAIEPRPDDEENKRPENEAGTDEIESFVNEGVTINSGFIALSALAGVLAAGGLILNNVAIVVGAMVLAPLFRPIAMVGVAIALGDPRRIARGAACTGLSLAISAAVGGVFALLTPGVEVTAQIVARAGINAFDLIIAAAAGVAMALVLIRKDLTAMVGIVVAASIVPVAAALGVVLALGEWDLVTGAAFTLASNICGILLGLVIGLRAGRLTDLKDKNRRDAKLWQRRSLILGSAIALVLAGIAVWTFAAGNEGTDADPTRFADTPGVLAVWTTADGRIAMAVETGAFKRPGNLPDSAIILPIPAATSDAEPGPPADRPAVTPTGD